MELIIEKETIQYHNVIKKVGLYNKVYSKKIRVFS